MSSSFALENPVIAALDVDTAEKALELAGLLRGRVGALKVGPRLIVRYGRELTQALAKNAPLFIDNKYFDIPSTMSAALEASFECGATLATIHALSGQSTMQELFELEQKLAKQRPFKILAVTILTSFSEATLPVPLKPRSIEETVTTLTHEVFASGLTGLVCSPREVSAQREKYPQGFFVTPGIRLHAKGAGSDQTRVETPSAAMKAGASAFVVGRPIVAAKDPVQACEEILASLK